MGEGEKSTNILAMNTYILSVLFRHPGAINHPTGSHLLRYKLKSIMLISYFVTAN